MNNLYMLAQADLNEAPSQISSGQGSQGQETGTKASGTSDNNNVDKQPGQKKPFEPTSLIILMLMLVVMYFILFRGPKKRQQEHQKMIMSLKKNDRVRTIGGIIGTVVDISDNEITLKVDESNNTKIKVIPSAIGKNLSEEK